MTEPLPSMPSSSEPPDATEKKGLSCLFSRLWVFAVVFVIALVGGAVLYSTYDTGEPTALFLGSEVDKAADLHHLKNRLTQTEARLKTLEERLTGLESAAVTPQGTATATTFATGDQGAIDSLKKDIEALQKQLTHTAQQTTEQSRTEQEVFALLLALSRLQSQIDADEPFEADLARLAILLAGRAEATEPLSRLQEAAPRGVASMDELAALWQTGVKTATTALREAQAHTWQDRLKAALRSLVSIRQASETSTGEAILADMERALKIGHLGEALALFEELPTAAQDALAQWQERARARVAVRQSLGNLVQVLFDALSPPPKKEEP